MMLRIAVLTTLVATSAFAFTPKLVTWVPGDYAEDSERVERILTYYLNEQNLSAASKHEFFPESRVWDQSTIVLASAVRSVPAVVRLNRIGSTAFNTPDGRQVCHVEVEVTLLPAADRFDPWTGSVGVNGYCFSPLLGSALEAAAERISRLLVTSQPR